MPGLHDILNEIAAGRQAGAQAYDTVRRRCLMSLHQLTQRNLIVYYSGWLQRPKVDRYVDLGITDNDKNGFMAAVQGMDRSLGLDLVLHTPGGDMAATESIVHYLHAMFPTDLRAIIPQMAMSGGTVIACGCDRIVMGKQSCLGPIDPQIGGRSAHAYLEEFEQAKREILADPLATEAWRPILEQYRPTLIVECRRGLDWASEMVEEWLAGRMLAGRPDAKAAAKSIAQALSDHDATRSHNRHIPLEAARRVGLVVDALEDDDRLQDAVLSVHHACMVTLAETAAVKLIENHEGRALIQQFWPPPDA